MDQKLCALMFTLSGLVLGDKEYAHYSNGQEHYPDGGHNVDYDRNIVIESLGVRDDFSKMSIDEVKDKVSRHMSKIDLDHNGLINKHEISTCVFNYYQKVDEDEAKQKLLDVDENSDNYIQWEEYLRKVYGYETHEIVEFKKDTSQDMKSFLKLVSDDLSRFQTADINKDGKLNPMEYGAFLYPSNYEYMHDYEIGLTMSQIDRNGDGFITFDEYLGDSTPAKEQRIVDHENFMNYDTNLDGRLDKKEIKVWLLPNKRTLAEEEAEHLIEETDSDGDGELSVQEIIDKYDIWLGSAATHYGDGFKHDPSEL